MTERVQAHVLSLTVELEQDVDAMTVDDDRLFVAVLSEQIYVGFVADDVSMVLLRQHAEHGDASESSVARQLMQNSIERFADGVLSE